MDLIIDFMLNLKKDITYVFSFKRMQCDNGVIFSFNNLNCKVKVVFLLHNDEICDCGIKIYNMNEKPNSFYNINTMDFTELSKFVEFVLSGKGVITC